jgi:hypothetical protein
MGEILAFSGTTSISGTVRAPLVFCRRMSAMGHER